MQKELAVSQNATSLTDSVKLQEDMLKELRTGNIYKQMETLNKTTAEKLDIIAENTAQASGLNFIGGGSGGSKTAPAKSQGRAGRMGNRRQPDNWLP